MKKLLLLNIVIIVICALSTKVYAVTAPSASPVSICGSGSVTITASGGSPGGGTYDWYNASSGGTLLQSSTSTTYTTTISSTTTFYVCYTKTGVSSTRTAVTATVNPEPVISKAPTGSGLYLSYPFTGNVNDSSSAGNNGTVQNSPSLTTDRYGAANSAYSFNGTNQYITTATQIAAPGPGDFSISVWFKTSSAGGKLVGFGSSQTGSSSQNDRQLYMSNSGQLYFALYPNAYQTINTTTNYADGSWHHAVAVCSSTSGSSLYVDGALQVSDATMISGETDYSGYWRVAYDNLISWPSAPTDYRFSGSLDDIAIYSSAITAAQVYTLYGAGSPPTCVGSPLVLQVNTVTGATYAWSGPNGFTSTSQNPTVSSTATTAMAGTYTCVVTGSNGCTSSIKVTAVVNASASSTFTATSSVVVGSNSTITYTGTDPVTSTYTWNFNGGTIVSGSGSGPYTVSWATAGSKTITLTVTNSSGCSTSSTQTVVVGSTFGSYIFSDPIALNTTSLGITSNLTNFPVLLSIQDNNLIISGSPASCTINKVYSPNGPNYDFAFYDPSTSTELNYQVESYNQTTGTLLVWVQIPLLTYAANKSITFYYGSPTTVSSHNTAFYESTWASDYKAVFHFNESSYTGSVTDGTTGGHTGTTSGMTSADLVIGKIGSAYSFNGSSKKIASSAITLTGSFTISAWVKLSGTGVLQSIMTNQTSSGSSSGGYKTSVYSTNIPETETTNTTNRSTTPNPSAFTSGTWYYVQGVYNGSTLSTYVNGTQYKSLSTSNNPSSTNPFYIGVGQGGSTAYFNGIIDEVRVSNVAKSSDWLKAEYVNQNNPSSFATVGSTAIDTANAHSAQGILSYTWTGATSTDPTVTSNWSYNGGTPSAAPPFNGSATFTIPAGLTNYPALTANESLYGLTLASGASLNLNGYTLSVGCNIYNSSGGQILYGNNNSSGITWNGSASSQTYTGSSTAQTAQLGNMTINNSSGGTVTISGGPLDIYNTLTITKGNLAVGSSPAALTLKSTSTQTASIAAIPSGYSVTGNVSVERYLTGGSISNRGYRLLSSPVNSDGTNYSINYLKNSIILTGTNTSGGFDNTSSAKNPTLYLYRENLTNPAYTTFTNSNFRGINNITLGTNATPSYTLDVDGSGWNIPIGNGYLCFFRGDRVDGFTSETVSSYVPKSATLTASGKLNQGTVKVKDWFTSGSTSLSYTAASPASVRGFNLIGNPYASTINFEKFNRNGTSSSIYGSGFTVPATIYFFNPVTKQYCSYKQKTTAIVSADTTTNINPGVSSDGYASNMIASGQGFFIQTTTTGQTFTFTEAAKTSTQPPAATISKLLGMPKEFVQQPEPMFRLRLVQDSVNTDEVVLQFNNQNSATYAFDKDALDLGGNGAQEGLSLLSSDSVKLSIHGRPLPGIKQEIIPLAADGNTTRTYQFKKIELNNLPKLYDVWLMDNFMKDSLDMRANDTYSFDIDKTTPATYGAKRFYLLIRQNPAYACHLLSFTAVKVSNARQVQLVWVTENEENYTNFTVERSLDGGKTFSALGGSQGTASGTYSLLDKSPVNGLNLYRLKTQDVNNMISYSKIQPVQYSDLSNSLAKGSINVYPNPVSGNVNLVINQGIQPVAYNIMISNSLGRIVKQVKASTPTWQGSVSDLLPGTYIVKVINNQDDSVIGEAKFVKL